MSLGFSVGVGFWVSALVGTFSRLLDGRLWLQAVNRSKSRKIEPRGTDGPEGPSRSSVAKEEPSAGFRGGSSSTSTHLKPD